MKAKEKHERAAQAIQHLDDALRWIEDAPGFIRLERKILKAIDQAEELKTKYQDVLIGDR